MSDTEAIDTVAMAQAFNEKDQGVADARQALEQALALYRPKSDYYQLLQQTIANPGFVKSLQSFDAGKYDDIFIEFNPHRGSRSPNELKVGELVFAPTVSRQSVLIPLAVPMEALDDATRRVLTSNILVDGQVAIDAQIQEGIVGVFGIDEHECSAPPTPQERRRAANQLSLQLLQNRIHDLRENRGARLTSTILVADSGFYYDDRFTGVPFRDGHLQSTLQHEQERPSIGFTSPSDATHGTSVSGLVLGGPDLIDRANALGYEVKLDSRSIYRLVGIERDQAGQLLRDHEGNTTERYVALAIPKKVQRALERGNADVVNLSLGGQLQEFESPDFLRNHTALFVIAAGNYGTVTKKADAGVDVGQHDIYPARYGGSGGDGRFNLLTVAALDWNGTLASFSNYGQQEVQIAAFGCGVPTWTYNLDQQSYHEARLSGTSFAAPAVSYVAGLLIASLPPRWAQAARVKARLLASADLEPSLFEKIEDGRVLNPFKALSLYDDVLEELVLDDSGDSGDPGPSEEAVVDEATREIPDDAAPVEEDEVRGEVLGQNPPRPTATVIHRGELKKGRSLDEFCQFVSQPDDTYLLKVAQHPDRNKRGLLRYYWIKGEELEFDECEPKENLAIAIETSTGSRVVPWDRVKDIVFRYPFD
ncbi:MAG: S8 family serine peptidase [Thermoanaerobaculia bacterium]|nr:S8 family serine peptidase [Thermoanaerobaculia bacterium]